MLSCSLQNNLQGGEMLFEIEIVFQTTFWHRGGYSATTTRTSILYFFSTMATKWSWSFSSIEEQSRPICDVILKQNCWESCSLLHPGDFRKIDDEFSYWKGIGFILLIRGRITWNSNASPKFDLLHANTKYTRSTPHLNPEIYM